jgi:hypothetical protein
MEGHHTRVFGSSVSQHSHLPRGHLSTTATRCDKHSPKSSLFLSHHLHNRNVSRARRRTTPPAPHLASRASPRALSRLTSFVSCFIHIADSIPRHSPTHPSLPAGTVIAPSPPALRLRLRRASRPHSSRDRFPAHDPRLPRVTRIQTLGVHHCRRGLFTHPRSCVRARRHACVEKWAPNQRGRFKIIPQPPPPRRVPDRLKALSPPSPKTCGGVCGSTGHQSIPGRGLFALAMEGHHTRVFGSSVSQHSPPTRTSLDDGDKV